MKFSVVDSQFDSQAGIQRRRPVDVGGMVAVDSGIEWTLADAHKQGSRGLQIRYAS